MMNHSEVERNSVVERYARGELSEQEQSFFEDHLLSCPNCQQELELELSLAEAVRAYGLEGALGRPLGAQRGWKQMGAIAAGILLLVALPSLYLWRQNRLLEGELQGVQSRLQEVEIQSRQRLEALQRELEQAGAADREAASLLEALREELQSKDQQLAALGRRLSLLRQPTPNLPIIFLEGLRSPETPQIVPVQRGQRWLVLALDVSGEEFSRYQVLLTDGEGETLWSHSELRPEPYGILTMQFSTELLQPGEYRLLLSAVSSSGQGEALREYIFRITPQ